MAEHQPYVLPSQSPAELTPRSLALGAILGLIFGASNVYLALKIGLTVSASIPIAVLSITIFRALGRATILENNIVQTTGSAADSVSAGVVFTIPAILLMGYDLDISRVAILAVVGGVMGVLMMIPLRRALIVKEHGNLPYPEGTACAEVLIAGERGGVHARTVFQAFGIAFAYKFFMTALKLWQEYPGKVLRSYQSAEVRLEASPELLGVGYIIGPRIAGYLFAGGCLAYVVLMPAIKLFGSAMTEPMFGTTKLIRDMNAGEVRAAFVFYIGAGAVATAGIIALARSLPTIVSAPDRRQSARRGAHHHLRVLLHDRLVPHLRAGRQFRQPHLRNDHRGADRDLLHLLAPRLDPDRRSRAGDLGRVRDCGGRRERRQHVTGLEDRVPGR